MDRAKITYKGQVTIPKGVREALDLKDGDSVLFIVEKDQALLKPMKRKSLEGFYGVLPATKPYRGMELIREEVHKKISKGITEKRKR
jgi:antitoxin PrlF